MSYLSQSDDTGDNIGDITIEAADQTALLTSIDAEQKAQGEVQDGQAAEQLSQGTVQENELTELKAQGRHSDSRANNSRGHPG